MNTKHPQVGDQVFFSARVPNFNFERTGSTSLVQGLGTVVAVPFNNGSTFRASYEVDVVGHGRAACVRAALTFPAPAALVEKHECRGHMPEHYQPQGETFYCDGSCRRISAKASAAA